MLRILRQFSSQRYGQVFNKSVSEPNRYWLEQSKAVKWFKAPKRALESSSPHFFRWFPDGKINIVDCCLDQQLPTLGSQTAYYLQSPITSASPTQISYQQLHGRVSKFAHSLQRDFGIKKGDHVAIYMPMVVESVIAMLSCARIGAIHVVVFGGFSAKQLANRLVDSNTKLIICANAGKEPNKVIDYLSIVNEAIVISKTPQMKKIIFQRPNLQAVKPLSSGYYDFKQVQIAGSGVSPTIMDSNDPLYVLYTSGTTGKPKGIVRDHGGTAVALKHAISRIYNGRPKDSFLCTSDIGWVLGHSFIVYGPLVSGMKSVLFEGKPVGTPHAGVLWEIIARNKIDHFYTSPTAARSVRKEDPNGSLIKDVSSLKTVTVVGERCDIPTFQWLKSKFPKAKIIDCYWQTETGSPILSNFTGFKDSFQPKPGSAAKPVPGYQVEVLHETTGKRCKPMEPGIICLKEPLPPSFMLTLLNSDDKYLQKYFSSFPGYYNTGDAGYVDQEGYHFVMSRIDDIINTAGHRLSTGEMEEVAMKQSSVAQAIVIGVTDPIKGEVPIGFVTLKAGSNDNPSKVAADIVRLVREDIGPVASFKHCFVVPRIPKTRSGKYLRNIVRKMCNGERYEVPQTIEDMSVVAEIEEFIQKQWIQGK